MRFSGPQWVEIILAAVGRRLPTTWPPSIQGSGRVPDVRCASGALRRTGDPANAASRTGANVRSGVLADDVAHSADNIAATCLANRSHFGPQLVGLGSGLGGRSWLQELPVEEDPTALACTVVRGC